jgi:diguanylate cyclase (GGDEF)-like protein
LDDATMDAAQTLADVAAAYLLNAQARADLRDSSEDARERALHDALTGLPNRVLFLGRLDHAVLRGRRSGKIAAVFFADLDRFKLVNDRYGHSVGDQLLVAVAQRLTAELRPGDTLARMSGDEFVILCEDLGGRAQADMIASRIGAAIAAPFSLSGAEVEVTASVGIAFSGRGDQLSERLLQDADMAMYQAKRKGGAQHQIIDLREQRLEDQRLNLERDPRWAPRPGELFIDYQPIVETGSGRISGVEALLTWVTPSRGAVTPTFLMPRGEHPGVSSEIRRWVLEQACPDRHRWQHRRPGEQLTLSVNVSADQLLSHDYATTVAAVLESTDTDPKLLTLEVNEHAFVRDAGRALIVLNELKRVGVNLALDDFGTGFSSLSYLKRFPIDIVKIDPNSISELGSDPASHAIVFAVVELAHILGMAVVAGGVETRQQHQELVTLGCDYCQGAYFARPMSADDVDALIQQGAAAGTLRVRQDLPANRRASA